MKAWRRLALASMLLAACGGSSGGSAGPGDAAAGDATVASDAGASNADAGAQIASPCPSSQPTPGSSCAREGLQCEYGTQWHVECDVLMVCHSGSWQEQLDGGACAWAYADGGAACPATGNPPQGACALGTDCEFSQGHCDCAVSCGGPTPPPDAAASWICTPPPLPGCTAARPRLGEGCGAGASDAGCDYRQCCSGVHVDCVDGGYWQGTIQLGSCP